MPPPPIFVVGRQHSGNTMLAAILGRAPGAVALTGEGTLFEHADALAGLPPSAAADRVLALIQHGSHQRGDASVWSAVREAIAVAAAEGASPAKQYARGMDRLVVAEGGTRWVQKATSYVFYAQAIWATWPDARLVFLARNPLDIAASRRRRGHAGDVVRMALGWRRGTHRAVHLAEAAPDRVHIVRYEDVVGRPHEAVARVCAFCDLPFEPSMLDVPHVNRAEAPYAETSAQRGIDASRIARHEQELPSSDALLVRALTGSAHGQALYPDLDGRGAPVSVHLRAAGTALASAARLVGDQAGAFVASPGHVARRVAQRLAPPGR